MNTKYNYIEEALLKEADILIEKTKSQGEKALYDLFKSAILKKYKDQYDVEIQKGEIKKEAVEKSIDFLFADACVRFRVLPYISDSIKDDVIEQAQRALPSWKTIVTQMLTEKGIKIM